jgi:glutathione S-transferase
VYFGGRPTPDALKAKALRDLLKGFDSLARRAKFAPYLAGPVFTLADIYFLYSVDLACGVGQKLFGVDFLADMPAARALLATLALNPNVQRIAADKAAETPAFLQRVRPAPVARGAQPA